MIRVEGTFAVTSWSEEPAADLGGGSKITVASIGQRFSGGIDADTVLDTVMAYRDDGTAQYRGYQRVDGEIQGRRGAFVLEVVGVFDGAVARTDLIVMSGTATGALAGLRGAGTSVVSGGADGTFTLDIELNDDAHPNEHEGGHDAKTH